MEDTLLRKLKVTATDILLCLKEWSEIFNIFTPILSHVQVQFIELNINLFLI